VPCGLEVQTKNGIIGMLTFSPFPRPLSQNAVVPRHTTTMSYSTVSIPFTHLQVRSLSLSSENNSQLSIGFVLHLFDHLFE
jgi:hypothetical protein